MSNVVEDFANRILAKYKDVMEEGDYRMITGDVKAGEYEVAAISAVEKAPVNVTEVDELMELATRFDGLDAEVAPRVARRARQRIATAHHSA